METAKLNECQQEIDAAIQDYYNRTDDGGNEDERFRLARAIAKRYNLHNEGFEKLIY